MDNLKRFPKVSKILYQIKDHSLNKLGKASQFILGNHVNESYELEDFYVSETTKAKKNDNKHGQFKATDDDNLNDGFLDYNTIRNTFSTAPCYRKGPTPLEKDNDIDWLSKRGSLIEWNDAIKAFSDNDQDIIEPNSKMLLTYVSRLGTGEDDEEFINLQLIQDMLEAGAVLDYGDVYGQSVFFGLIRDWHVDVARFAIQRGANVNHRDNFGRTPLHLAAAVNYAEMVELLIENGAEIDARTSGELQEPLHFAARYDAPDIISLLIMAGAKIDTLDFLKRSPLHLAIFHKNEAATKALLQMGAPAGEFDAIDQSAMVLLVTKLPNLAPLGLDQFYDLGKPVNECSFYLESLECKKGNIRRCMTVLQAITKTYNTEIILHPAIQKLLNVKWNLFGKADAIITNLFAILYILLSTVIVFSLSFDEYDKQFEPLDNHGWKIGLGVIFVLMTVWFVIENFRTKKHFDRQDRLHRKCQLDYITKQEKYCHPCWPEEKLFLMEEKKIIEDESSSFLTEFWNIYDFFALTFSVAMFVLIFVNALTPSKLLFTITKTVSALTLLLQWFRLYKTMRVIVFISEIIVLLEQIFIITTRICVVIFDFYFPYVFAFYMLFGGDKEDFDKTKGHLETEHSIQNMLYRLIMMDLTDREGEFINAIAYHIFAGTYFAGVMILSYYFIGLMSEAFSRKNKTALARAYLSTSLMFIRKELLSGDTKKRNNLKYMRMNCNPLISQNPTDRYTDDKDQTMIKCISNLSEKVVKVIEKLNKAQFPTVNMFTPEMSDLQVAENHLKKIRSLRTLTESHCRKIGLEVSKVKTDELK